MKAGRITRKWVGDPLEGLLFSEQILHWGGGSGFQEQLASKLLRVGLGGSSGLEALLLGSPGPPPTQRESEERTGARKGPSNLFIKAWGEEGGWSGWVGHLSLEARNNPGRLEEMSRL